MRREEELRGFWESRIPAEWDVIVLSDAHRAINRGLSRPIISLRTLQRRAAAGEMGAFGGPGTGLADYRVRRDKLLEFLLSLDFIITEPAPPPAAVAARPRPKKKKRRRRKSQTPRIPDATPAAALPPKRWDQATLFDGDDL